MCLKQGLEYEYSDLNNLVNTYDSDASVIGFVFRIHPEDSVNRKAFSIRPLRYNHSTSSFLQGEDHEEILPSYCRRWIKGESGFRLPTHGIAPFMYTDLEHYQPSFVFAVFMKSGLKSLLASQSNLVISGMCLDYASLTPYNHDADDALDTSVVFTLKIEAICPNVLGVEPSTSVANSLGSLSVLFGLPCPPYWMSPGHGAIIAEIMPYYLRNVQSMNSNVAKTLISGDIMQDIRNSWGTFLYESTLGDKFAKVEGLPDGEGDGIPLDSRIRQVAETDLSLSAGGAGGNANSTSSAAIEQVNNE